MICMLGILWLLNAILGREGFGVFMVAFSLMFTLAMIMGSGFQSLLMYHVSRLHEAGEERKIQLLTGQIFWITLLLSTFTGLLIFTLAAPLEKLIGLEGFVEWVRLMSFFIPAHAAAMVLPSLPRARHRAEQTTIYQEIVLNGFRVGFLALIWGLGLSVGWIAAAYIASAFIPVFLIFIRFPVWPSIKDNPLHLWDFKYVGKISIFQILNQPFRGFDVLLVGWLASAGVAADYTIATRLAQLLWVPKHAAAQLQVPRMGALLDRKDYSQLMLEYNAMRSVTLFCVLLGAAFLLFLGPNILTIFGNYSQAFTPLLLLGAAAVMRTGVGTSGDLISMAGHAGWSAIVALISMIVTLCCLILLIPENGAFGASMAVCFGTLVLFSGYWLVLAKIEKIQTMPLYAAIITALAVFCLVLPTINLISPVLCGFIVIILGISTLLSNKDWLIFMKSH